ncbi:MAG: 4Fe-4S dicluster domain-containing protein [Duncaniella sp.]|nr:4Fe-4S dicluster domain-containing protein [Duncaniella sp.]
MNRREWLGRVGSIALGSVAVTSCGRPEVTSEVEVVSPRIADAYEPISQIDCVACDNCMPCPYGINIPGNLIFVDQARYRGYLPGALDEPDFASKADTFFDRFQNSIPDPAQAQHCISCGQCLPMCPDHIDIPRRMAQITALTDLIRNLRCLKK